MTQQRGEGEEEEDRHKNKIIILQKRFKVASSNNH